MVSPHLAPSCWAHSMPRSHCSHQRGTSESHSNIPLANFPLGLPVTLHGWWKWPSRAAELPMASVSLQHLILRHAELKPILWAFFLLGLISSWWLTSESIRILNYHYSPLNLADAGLCMEQRNHTWTGRGKAAAQIEGTAPRAHCIATTVTHWKLIIKICLNHVSFVVLSKLNKRSFTAW